MKINLSYFTILPKQLVTISYLASLATWPTLGQSAALNTITKPAVNLSDTAFYTSNYQFINMMHRASPFFSNGGEESPYQNKYGWLQNLPAGAYATTAVAMDLDERYGYLRPGQYKVMSSSNATLNIIPQTGLSNIVNGVKQATFTVNKAPDGIYSESKGYRIDLEVKNNTASVIPLINDIQLYHVDDTADLLAGKIFTKSFKEQIKHCATLRPMVWLGTNNSETTNFSELSTEAHRMWHSWSNSRVPYSVATKLMLEIGAETGKTPTFWVNVPVGNKANLAIPNDITNTFQLEGNDGNTPSDFTDGEPVFLGVESSWQSYPTGLKPNTVYYVKNNGKTLQLSSKPNEAAIDFGKLSNTSLYHPYLMSMRDPQSLFDQIFKTIYNTKHTISGKTYLASNLLNVKVELSNETWNSQFAQTHWLHDAGRYMINAGTYADPNAWLSLKAWKAATNAGFARNKVTRVLAGQVVYFENNGDGLSYIDSKGIIQKGVAVKNLVDQYAVAPYFGFQRAGGSAEVAYTIDDAILDKLHIASDAVLMQYVTRGIDEIANEVATTKAKLAALNPAIGITSYEAGQHLVDYNGVENSSVANVAQFGIRMVAFLRNDQIAKTVHQTYLQKVFLDKGLQEYNQFTSSGEWRNQSVDWENKPVKLFSQWGMARSTHTLDTPLMLWWKSLN